MLSLYISDVHAPLTTRKRWMIYADNEYKMVWDVFISIILLFVCFVVPLRLALNLDVKTDDNGTVLKGDLIPNQHVLNSWEILMYVCDGFFLCDLIMCFFTTIEDKEKMVEVTDQKVIVKEYLTGWFWVDSISIIPFDRIVMAFIADDTTTL